MEDNLVFLSWIHEYAFCPRRFYLRVCEGQCSINTAMAEGKQSHKRVDSEKIEKRGNLIQVFGLKVHSKEFDLYGVCDRVDFYVSENGTYIDFLNEKCLIHPVEFKHGRKRNADDYMQQLCGQAICLEEMFGCEIEEGTLWYTGTKQSLEICISKDLKERTLRTIEAIKKQVNKNKDIKATYRKLCNNCAMFDICDPRNDMSIRYVKRLKNKLLEVEQ